MRKAIITLLIFIFWSAQLCAQVSLAGIFSDNMVLQAHKPIQVWGTAAPGEQVVVRLEGQQQRTKTDKKGKWKVTLSPMEYGTARTLRVSGKKNEIELTNVMIGEVWLCSGQSNMAMTVNGKDGQVDNYRNEENEADYPLIRSFKVAPGYATTVVDEVEGKWEVCSPETVGEFSAVAYFFARKVHQETGVPIGIINSSWGGTDIETWISGDTYRKLPDEFQTRYLDRASSDINEVLEVNAEKQKLFAAVVASDIGVEQRWFEPSFDAAAWKTMKQPQEWSHTALAAFDGVVWFRYEFDV